MTRMSDLTSPDIPSDAQDSGMRWCSVHLQRKQSCIRDGYHKRQCNIVPLFFMNVERDPMN